jgi:Domain of unknown function (DUF1902)
LKAAAVLLKSPLGAASGHALRNWIVLTEADSRDHLVEKLAVLIPELLELNNRPTDPHQPIDLLLHFRRKAEKSEERVADGTGAFGGS